LLLPKPEPADFNGLILIALTLARVRARDQPAHSRLSGRGRLGMILIVFTRMLKIA